jgi:hypothetical protein
MSQTNEERFFAQSTREEEAVFAAQADHLAGADGKKKRRPASLGMTVLGYCGVMWEPFAAQDKLKLRPPNHAEWDSDRRNEGNDCG